MPRRAGRSRFTRRLTVAASDAPLHDRSGVVRDPGMPEHFLLYQPPLTTTLPALAGWYRAPGWRASGHASGGRRAE
jgi:hypothetical protein